MKIFTKNLSLGLVFFCIQLLSFQKISASIPNITASIPKIIFEENKNQWPRQVLYQSDLPNGKVFFEKNTFTYIFHESLEHHHDNPNSEAERVKHHSFKVNFLNANSDVSVSSKDPYPFYRNYFLGNDKGKWAEGVQFFKEVNYTNLYPGIDMNVYTKDESMKYDLILQPGANHNWIKLKYEGADLLSLRDGHLIIKTSVGEIIEQKPFAYQLIDGVQTEVSCSYTLDNNNVLGFKISSIYNRKEPLIIDPTLIVSTFTGSTANNFGFTATYDAAGNIYTGGIVYGIGYPTVVGSYDLNFHGTVDISLTKFNPTGSALIYSTYYGGVSSEQPHSLIVNSSNQLFVVGRTNSLDFPTLGAYDAVKDIGYDIIVGKFTSTGGLSASTFVGGDGDDGVNYSTAGVYASTKFNYADDGRGEIMLDNAGNVLVSMCTQSTTFPTVNAYDASLGGSQDACVFKLNNILSGMLWSTYLGGSGYDAGFGIKVDASNNVYVTGGTESADFPTSTGVIHTAQQGGLDGFITVFNSTGVFQRSTYIGTTSYDQCFFIELDNSNAIYVMGQTMGAYPVSGGVYSNANGKQFIHKLNNLLTATAFSTVFGTGGANPDISPTAFLVDSCQNLYVSGWGRCAGFGMLSTGTTTGLPVTANAYQSTTDGCDFYFFVLTANAQSLWYATFFGRNGGTGDHVDGGTSRFDRRAVIYQSVCAGCSFSSAFPTTAGAYSTVNGNSCNNAVIKMDVRVNPLAVATANPPSLSGCAPFLINFFSTGSYASSYQWDFGDGSGLSSSASPSHTYTASGTYTVTFTATLTNGVCNLIDIKYLVITVGSASTIIPVQSNVSCFSGTNGSSSVSPAGGLTPYTYAWSPGGQTTSAVTGLTQGTYTVVVGDNAGCSATGTVSISQPTAVSLATYSSTPTSCSNNNGTASVNPSGGTPAYTYSWSAGGQTTQTATGLAPGTYTVTVRDNNNCLSTRTVSVSSITPPSVSANSTATSCAVPSGTATANPVNGTPSYTYSWIPSGQTTISATGLTGGNYTVTLSDANGCTATNTVTVNGNSAPTITTTSTTIAGCSVANGTATANATGGAPAYTYSWLPGGQTDQTATGLSGGDYTITITDQNGCSVVTTVSVSTTSAPTTTTSVSQASCGNSNGTATANPTGGSPGYTYSWNNGQTTQTATGLTAGLYIVTITDANGCTTSDVANISNANGPTATSSVTANVSCFGGNSGSATANPSGGTPGYTYVWSNGQTNQTATGLISGNYTVTVTDANGCPVIATAVISQPAILSATTSQTSILCNGGTASASITPAGGTPAYTYNWSSGQTTSAASPLNSGSYTVMVTDANGCTYSNVFSFTQPAALTSIATQTAILCNGGSGSASVITAGGTPAYSYNWSSGQTTSAIAGIAAGNYSVTITDVNGCTSQAGVSLTQPTSLLLSVSGNDSICAGDTAVLNASASGGTPNYTYTWIPGPQNGQSISVSPGSSTTYSVIITDANGCISNMQTLSVALFPNPNALFDTLSNGLYGAVYSFGDQSTGSTSWYWTFGDGSSSTLQNPIHTFPGAGTYTVTQIVFNQFGCPDTFKLVINFEDGILIPNVFTPDGDGINDVWYIPNSGLREFHVDIYDRWGLKVFETTADEIRWDGYSSAGKLLSDGTYYYVLKAILKSFNGDKDYSTKGHVTLLTTKRK